MPVTSAHPSPQSQQVPTAESETTSALQSCLYEGVVSHQRQRPALHQFKNRLFLHYIDLDEVDRVFRFPFLWSTNALSLVQFRRADYHGDPNRPLADCVRETIYKKAGIRVTGPIRLLTHVRYFGFVFNPVSFYYCFDDSGSRVTVVMVEVMNTPWDERYCYVIPCADDGNVTLFEQPKEFHVSPFMNMAMLYRWNLRTPDQRLFVCIESDDDQGWLFDATLSLTRRPFSGRNVITTMLRFPFMALAVVAAIYWQAFRLWLRRVPFVPHPRRKSGSSHR
jgi:DUF1365 family protein